ncbi:hypothetical protein AtubIFM54640_004026 [Aspergillus tubingensis]|uniref:uncharacterized protein n=1 Tax=Aspergillus tubingensis TaxID=5068 RepID=UPI001578FE12|nr:similar to An12g09180 [Aspergillus tubingensis]GFN11570.1 similar to An12g09180 [Aspergillus tubingensis]GLA62890.1 hypothetical protein AtubIFM54640_004026 [Aspergillus tubingensis]GLA93434.1 hypothetical protein AtubIFM57143_010786 [Aspergillus tubingensis]GLB20689.1 hypothetical protein AtubIFM61612_010631 [Aspergillus tubingensis]
MHSLLLLPTLLLTAITLTTAQYLKDINPIAVDYPVYVDFVPDSTHLADLESPKLSEVNTTVFEWWYFDAISSTNPNASIVLTFFTTTATAFPAVPQNLSSVLLTYVWATLPNGTTVSQNIVPIDASVMGDRDVSSGGWEGTGGWAGRESGYEAWVGWEGGRVSGRMVFRDLAPPLLPCSTPQQMNRALGLGEGLGWVSMVPDSHAMVDLVVDGEKVQFMGFGYHDKNWGNRPFQNTVKSWSWGHVHIGQYALVWLQYTPREGGVNNNTTPIVSAYLARDGKVVQSGCRNSLINIYENMTASSYGVDVEMDGVVLMIRGRVEVAGDGKNYFRWNGVVSGTVEGQKLDGGVAVFEGFRL